jgi:Flp pilus assembly pilin Flp
VVESVRNVFEREGCVLHHSRDRGAVAVEFALVLPLLTLFLLGVIQYGFGLFQLQNFTAALGDASRSAGTGIENCLDFDSRVRDLVGGTGASIDPDDVGQISVEWLTDGLAPAQRPERLGMTRVTASFKPFRLGVPFIPFPETITRSATAPVQDILSNTLPGC